jgi:hypothetical protein
MHADIAGYDYRALVGGVCVCCNASGGCSHPPAIRNVLQGDPLATELRVKVLTVEGLSLKDQTLASKKHPEHAKDEKKLDKEDGVEIEISNPFATVRSWRTSAAMLHACNTLPNVAWVSSDCRSSFEACQADS